jgi:hypothetical protein
MHRHVPVPQQQGSEKGHRSWHWRSESGAQLHTTACAWLRPRALQLCSQLYLYASTRQHPRAVHPQQSHHASPPSSPCSLQQAPGVICTKNITVASPAHGVTPGTSLCSLYRACMYMHEAPFAGARRLEPAPAVSTSTRRVYITTPACSQYLHVIELSSDPSQTPAMDPGCRPHQPAAVSATPQHGCIRSCNHGVRTSGTHMDADMRCMHKVANHQFPTHPRAGQGRCGDVHWVNMGGHPPPTTTHTPDRSTSFFPVGLAITIRYMILANHTTCAAPMSMLLTC